VHFVEVTLNAGEHPGQLQTPIRIVTDKENHGATCIASATIVQPPAAAAAPASASKAADAGAVRTASAP